MISVNKNTFTLENKYLRRKLQFNSNGLQTTELLNKKSGSDFAHETPGCEFMLKVDNSILFGNHTQAVHVLDGSLTKTRFSLDLLNSEITQDNDWKILKVNMVTNDACLQIASCYAISEKFPAIRKWLEFKATKNLKISNIYIECLHAYPGKLRQIEIFRSNAPESPLTYFVAKGDTDFVQLYSQETGEGYFLSSNIPGPLRKFLVYPHWSETSLSAGYNTEMPNTVYLQKGDVYKSHEAFLHIFTGKFNDNSVYNEFRSFIRNKLPVLPNEEGLMFCTWIPFLKNITEELLIKLIDKAAELGFLYFVIDDGWFVDPGWMVDPKKFPNGLEPIVARIHKKNMKLGLWFNIGTDYGNSRKNPENNRRGIDKTDDILGFSGSRTVQCLASGHRDIVADNLIMLAEKYDVDYFKMDFSSIVSPYGILAPGCHHSDHEFHHNFDDSVIRQYESLYYIRKKVKEKFPDIVLDFSFETFGTEKPGIAALQYSELHHISNMNTNDPDKCSALNIRNNLYGCSTVLPVERLLGSLICLQGGDEKQIFENLLTSLVTAPLMAGNLLKISPETVSIIKSVSALLNPIYIKNGDLTGFIKIHDQAYVRPSEMDGFIRYNPEGWGIICVFSNDSGKQSASISIENISSGNYLLKNSKGDDIELSGEELKNGFSIHWNDNCELFTFERY